MSIPLTKGYIGHSQEVREDRKEKLVLGVGECEWCCEAIEIALVAVGNYWGYSKSNVVLFNKMVGSFYDSTHRIYLYNKLEFYQL